MIQRAVFSYFNPQENFSNKCGFKHFQDFLHTTALASLCASNHFKEVVMVSSKWGVEMFKKMKFPFTEYSEALEDIKDIPKCFWAYGKMVAYTEQKKPFIHVDNDVFLWNPLPERILKAQLCFQSHEDFYIENYKWYNLLRNAWNDAPVKPQKIADNPVYDYAYNCGICGGNKLDFFKEWKKCSEEYILAPENKEVFFDKHRDLLIHQNLFHEQYFASSLIKMHGWRKKVEVLHPDALKINEGYPKDKPAYTHVWGTGKENGGVMARVSLTLFYRNRSLFDRIRKYCKAVETGQF